MENGQASPILKDKLSVEFPLYMGDEQFLINSCSNIMITTVICDQWNYYVNYCHLFNYASVEQHIPQGYFHGTTNDMQGMRFE